jgi:hypothetical protein
MLNPNLWVPGLRAVVAALVENYRVLGSSRRVVGSEKFDTKFLTDDSLVVQGFVGEGKFGFHEGCDLMEGVGVYGDDFDFVAGGCKGASLRELKVVEDVVDRAGKC